MLGFSKLKGLLSGQPWSQMEWHLFCYIFCLMLNSASIAVWGVMSQRGTISVPLAILTFLYLGTSLLVSAMQIREERKQKREKSGHSQ